MSSLFRKPAHDVGRFWQYLQRHGKIIVRGHSTPADW
jgi:hypothetical protein